MEASHSKTQKITKICDKIQSRKENTSNKKDYKSEDDYIGKISQIKSVS